MICNHCSDQLDPDELNCCEACDLQVELRARISELEARFVTLTDKAREALMLGSLERLLKADSTDGSVMLSRILYSWNDAVTERDRYREALERIAGLKGWGWSSETTAKTAMDIANEALKDA